MSTRRRSPKKIPKMLVSVWLGCSILAFHSAMTFALLFAFSHRFGEGVAIAEISIPITMTFAVTVVKWFVDTGGHIRKTPTVALGYVVGLCIVFMSFCVALAMGPYLYVYGAGIFNDAQINTYFAVVDGAFGVLLLIFLNDLFAVRK